VRSLKGRHSAGPGDLSRPGRLFTWGWPRATEAAAIGLVGSLLCAALRRQLNLSTLKKMFVMGVGVNAMVCWIMIGPWLTPGWSPLPGWGSGSAALISPAWN